VLLLLVLISRAASRPLLALPPLRR